MLLQRNTCRMIEAFLPTQSPQASCDFLGISVHMSEVCFRNDPAKAPLGYMLGSSKKARMAKMPPKYDTTNEALGKTAPKRLQFQGSLADTLWHARRGVYEVPDTLWHALTRVSFLWKNSNVFIHQFKCRKVSAEKCQNVLESVSKAVSEGVMYWRCMNCHAYICPRLPRPSSAGCSVAIAVPVTKDWWTLG